MSAASLPGRRRWAFSEKTDTALDSGEASSFDGAIVRSGREGVMSTIDLAHDILSPSRPILQLEMGRYHIGRTQISHPTFFDDLVASDDNDGGAIDGCQHALAEALISSGHTSSSSLSSR